MDLELAGRTAVVTGGSLGIGREIARVLAAEGVATLIVARRGADATGSPRHPRQQRRRLAPHRGRRARHRVGRIAGHQGPLARRGPSRHHGELPGPRRIHSEEIDQRLHPTAESREQFARNIPLGCFGDPADTAHLVTFLCAPKARYISGERLHVDGGYPKVASTAATDGSRSESTR